VAVTTLFGRATRRVPFDDVHLGLVRVALRAVGQLAGQRQAFERALANDQITGLAGGVTGAGRGQVLLHNGAGGLGVLLQKRLEGLADNLLHIGLHLGVHQFDLGLAFKLWVGVLDADQGGESFAGIFTGEVGVGFFEQAGFAGVIVDHAGEGHAQTGQVCAAIHRVDGVGKRIDRLVVAIGVLHRNLNANVLDLFFHIEDRVQHFAVAVEVAHKRADAAIKIERGFVAAALVHQADLHLPGDKSHFTEAGGQGIKAKFHVALEDLGVVMEGGAGAGDARVAFANRFDGFLRDAALVALEVNLAIAAHFYLAPL